MNIKNYYSLIKLSQNASAVEIAERCKAIFIENHPSKNKSNVAFKNFIDIIEVYGVLIDFEIRQDYDYILNKYSGKKTELESDDLQIIDKIENSIKKKKGEIKMILGTNDTMPINDNLDVIQLESIQSDGVKLKELFSEGLTLPDFEATSLDLNID